MLAGTTCAQGLTYKDPAGRYSIQFPSGWIEIDKALIERVRDLARKETGSTQVDYKTGFQLAKNPPMDYPYVLLQDIEASSPSYNEIVNSLDKIKSGGESAGQNSKIMSGIKLEPRYDREHGIIWIDIGGNVQGIGPIRGISGLVLGKNMITGVHCYTREQDFAAAKPLFLQIVNSLKYKEGEEYNEKTAGNGIGRSGLIGAGIGLLVALVAIIARKLRG